MGGSNFIEHSQQALQEPSAVLGKKWGPEGRSHCVKELASLQAGKHPDSDRPEGAINSPWKTPGKPQGGGPGAKSINAERKGKSRDRKPIGGCLGVGAGTESDNKWAGGSSLG